MSQKQDLQRKLEMVAASAPMRRMLSKDAKKAPFSLANSLVSVLIDAIKEAVIEGMDKQEVLEAVAKFYDDYVSGLDIPGKFDKLIHGLIKQAVLQAVEIGIDSIRSKLQPT